MKASSPYFKYRVGFLTLFLIFSFAVNVYSAGFTNTTYAYSLPITLQTTSLGITSNQTSFPYLVTITDASLVISTTSCNNKVQFPNGPAYDFAFVDATAGEVPYQVVSYNQTAGTLLVWVQVPTLTHSTNNLLTFYFGSATAPANHTTAFYQSTWPSDYQAVYHLDEGSSSAAAIDATTNVNAGTQTSTTAVAGKIGGAYSFNGSSSKIVALAPASVGGNFTFSAWVYVNTLQASQGIVTDESLLSGGRLGLYTSGGVKAGVEAKTAIFTLSDLLASGGTNLSAGTWYYVQGVCSTVAILTTTQTYVNGAPDRSTTGTSLSITPGPIVIGQDYGGVNIMNGIIDEVRISNVAKTADWIKAEYVDQSNPAGFCSSGALTVYSTFAAAIPGGLTYTWTGGTSNNPTVATNWTNTTTGTANQLPAFDGTATLIIGSGSFSPSLTADEKVFGLTVNSGATLNLNGHNLNIACNLNNTGTGTINWANSNTSAITWNGSMAAQSYNGGTTTGYTHVGNMVINNSASGTVTINNDTVDIYNQLTMTKGNLAVSPAAIVNIKSNAEQTANVASIPSGSSITGSVNVERYITGGTVATRTWRLMSSPIYNSAGTYNFVSNLKQNLIVTGTGGASAGFDPPASWLTSYTVNGPTVLTYSNGLFYGLTSSTQTAQVGTGFYFYFRGDRIHNLPSKLVSVGGVYAIPDANTIGLWTGTLNQGTQTLSLSGANSFFCIGNPYACTINANNITGTNLLSTGVVNVFVYDYTHNATNTTIATGVPYISSGEGIFVQSSTASTGSVVFSESMKDVTPAHQPGYTGSPAVPLTMSVVQHTGQDSYIRLRMILNASHSDLAYIRFNKNYKSIFDPTEDIRDFSASGQTVFFGSMTSDSVEVDVNSMPTVQKKLSFYLSVNASASGNYTIKKLDLVGIDKVYDVWLVDHYKNDTVNMRTVDSTTFAIDKTNPLTYGNSRFEVAIIQKELPPYQLISFTGKRVLLNNQLTWKTKNEYFYTTFDLQKSVDNGVTYNDIQTIQSDSTGSYSYTDKNAANAKLMYRLKQTDINNNVTYSNVVILQAGVNNLVEFDIFPNPTAWSIQFRLRQEVKLPLKMNIYNSSGILVMSTVFNANTGIQNVSSLSHGSYIINLLDSSTSKDLGMAKFIKL
ncbi:protein of unknown function [Mucilaginibacter mallensis]|uniref:LamG-like jellyroll fold domain-containing protein n=1 Tax=Mucilaginibacter mallensis TaxID=652787 RepID=A0A1H1SF36_MUCMA|nr:DUF2341 domain-containing protein [Mucilaginibacter mallensis]SDS46473.1 protein of unknown function [Mucilaginibacter mallensis]